MSARFNAQNATIVADQAIDARHTRKPFTARVYMAYEGKLVVVKLWIPQLATQIHPRPVMSTCKTWLYTNPDECIAAWRTKTVIHSPGDELGFVSERLLYHANRALIEHHAFLHDLV
jgi:hypothetical protein